MRPVDLAREHGLSSQAVRNYEAAGILPRADRTDTGYRIFTDTHARALCAFLALVTGHGHATATEIMATVHRGEVAEALTLIDRSHARLLADRSALDAVEQALGELTETNPTGRFPQETSVGTLARRLGIRAATLRRWERAGLLRPRRSPDSGYRVYGADDVRDAHLVHQLRRSGYLLSQIASLLDDLRVVGATAVSSTISDRRARLDAQARGMLTGAACLERYLRD